MAVKRAKPPYFKKIKLYVTSAVLGVGASVAALVLFSVLVFLAKFPVSQSGFFSTIAFGIGCLTAGFTAGASKRQGGLSAGIKAALLFALIVILAGIAVSGIAEFSGMFGFSAPAVAEAEAEATADTATASMGTLSKIIIAVICGALGGVVGVNKNGGF